MNIKTLPSVEERVKTICDCRKGSMDDKQYEATVEYNLTQDRNQAYTSLVEGIEGMRKDTEREPNKSDYLGRGKLEMIADIQGFGMDIAYNVALEDILEKVVKPLYGKE